MTVFPSSIQRPCHRWWCLLPIITRKLIKKEMLLLILPVLDIHRVPGNGLAFRQTGVPWIWRCTSCSLIGFCPFGAGHHGTHYPERTTWVPRFQKHLRKCHQFWLHSPMSKRHVRLWFQFRCCKWSKRMHASVTTETRRMASGQRSFSGRYGTTGQLCSDLWHAGQTHGQVWLILCV